MQAQEEPAHDDHLHRRGRRHRSGVSVEELARAKGAMPVEDPAAMAVPGLFESDEEYEEFLAYHREARRTGMA